MGTGSMCELFPWNMYHSTVLHDTSSQYIGGAHTVPFNIRVNIEAMFLQWDKLTQHEYYLEHINNNLFLY